MGESENVESILSTRARLLEKMGENAGEYPSHIERRFPQIFLRIADLWGTSALDDYLERLILPDRLGRQGFPPEVAYELFRLASLHDALGMAPKPAGDDVE